MAYECCAPDRAANCANMPPRRPHAPDAAMLPRHECKDGWRTDVSDSILAPRPASLKFHLCRVALHLRASIDPTVGGSSLPRQKARRRLDPLDTSSTPRAW